MILMVSVGYMQRHQQGLFYHRIKAITKGDQEIFLLSHAFKDFPATCQLNSIVGLSVNHYIDGLRSMSNLFQGPTYVCLIHQENLTDFNGRFLIPPHLNKYNAQERVTKE